MPIINQVVKGSGGSPTPATKFGVNIDGWAGDVITTGANAGKLRTDQAVGTLSMPGVTNLGGMLKGKFIGSTGLVGAVNLSSVDFLDNEELRDTFQGTSITSIDLSSVPNIGQQSLQRVCYNVSTLTNIIIPLNNAQATIYPHGMQNAFMGTGIGTFTCNVRQFGGDQIMQDPYSSAEQLAYAFAYCPSLRSLYFPYVTGNSFADIQQMWENVGEEQSLYDIIGQVMGQMITGCTNTTVHLTQQLEQDLLDAGLDTDLAGVFYDSVETGIDPEDAGITVVYDL